MVALAWGSTRLAGPRLSTCHRQPLGPVTKLGCRPPAPRL